MLLAPGRNVDEDLQMDVWSALRWIGLGAAIIGFAVIVLIARRPSAPDLGSVSSQWVAEHRGKSD
jgi:hypothetical protein